MIEHRKFVRVDEILLSADIETSNHMKLLEKILERPMTVDTALEFLEKRGGNVDMGVVSIHNDILAVGGFSGKLGHPSGRIDVEEIRNHTGDVFRRMYPDKEVIINLP